MKMHICHYKVGLLFFLTALPLNTYGGLFDNVDLGKVGKVFENEVNKILRGGEEQDARDSSKDGQSEEVINEDTQTMPSNPTKSGAASQRPSGINQQPVVVPESGITGQGDVPYLSQNVLWLLEVKYNHEVLNDEAKMDRIAGALYGNEWRKISRNKFELKRKNQEFKDKIIKTAKLTPNVYKLNKGWELPEYDFKNNGFWIGTFPGAINNVVIDKAPERTMFLPVSEANAEKLKYNQTGMNKRALIYLEVVAEITGIAARDITIPRPYISDYLLANLLSVKVYSNSKSANATQRGWGPINGIETELTGFLYEYSSSEFNDNENYVKLVSIEQQKAAPKPDAAAVFSQLPEEIQSRILSEGETAYTECSSGTRNNAYYDCDCVKLKVIENRTLKGPEPNPYSIQKDSHNSCIDFKSIAKYQKNKCKGSSIVDPRRYDYDQFCNCYGNTIASKAEERPHMISTLDAEGLLKRETVKECRASS